MSSPINQSMGIRDGKAHVSPSASSPKAGPTAGAVTGPGASIDDIVAAALFSGYGYRIVQSDAFTGYSTLLRDMPRCGTRCGMVSP